MMKHYLPILFLCFSLATPLKGSAQELPTTLVCKTNAVASREFVEPKFNKTNLWSGPLSGMSVEPFDIITLENKAKRPIFVSQRIFSNLDTKQPTVKTISEIFVGEEKEISTESIAQVLSGSLNSVEIALLWSHGPRWWLAIIDLSLKKATIGYVFRGGSSVGGKLETLDCL